MQLVIRSKHHRILQKILNRKGRNPIIFYTSDLHFGHSNIVRLCNRPFADVYEMDEALIDRWNQKVTNGDSVYILGDLMFRNEIPPEEYLCRLKGKKASDCWQS